MSNPRIIKLIKIGSSDLGYISKVEELNDIPFKVERVYWTYETPEEVVRGNHSHRELEQLLISINGEIELIIENNKGEVDKFILNSPSEGLYLPPGYWRRIKFCNSAVLLVLASKSYDESDYIRNYNQFKDAKV